uniref:S-protein homolog n=1 Tax=Kalanchoe fedtschenkoi TaxID=63787 RepID=A0A7N0TCC8_KALFE
MRSLLLIALVCTWVLNGDAETNEDLQWAKTHVRLFNKSERGVSMVEQCWSSDDDLGPHTVGFGQYYEFTFRPNWWGTTKFMCKVMFNNDGVWKYFLAYKYWRDSPVCAAKRQCDWDVNETQACRFDGQVCIKYT